MSADHPEIVIVRRRSTLEDQHHGGAWKIAFADFMTAMMAFFLVLWIISATDKNTKTIIARYFNPVKVEEPARAQKGIHGAADLNTQNPGRESGSQTPDKTRLDQIEPSGKPREARQEPPKDRSSPSEPADPARPKPTMSEDELFRDPRASLDKISGEPPPGPVADPASAPTTESADLGLGADEPYRDPFRPLGGAGPTRAAVAGERDEPPKASSDGPGAKRSDASAEASAKEAEKREDVQRQGQANSEASKKDAGFAEKKTPSGPGPASAKSDAAPAAEASGATGSAHAAALLADVRRRIGPDTPSSPGPQLEVQATEEGILISLTDRQNFSMFAIGSAEPQRRVVRMMDAIAATLKATAGSIVVRGHTDAHPYHSGHYDNWRLSSARAQMAYYMLNRAGVPEDRFERIEGFADHRPKDKTKPFAAENRRIEILVREARP